uniref:Probable ATP-dependent transporter ycf16 n=1 Tax=Cyanidium caldarium TaxID=2771 RepID=A0A7H0WBB4_CYACA|nr:cytochrome c1 ABC transporter ATP-binding subunit [Cyanidium caldarium]QNR39843.1 cytochrome c1 ABC transporter ATP-binding subunit [Cyanidium caldarium]
MRKIKKHIFYSYSYLNLINVTIYYEQALLLKNINLNLNKGEAIIIKGKNGSGKTTLLKSIAGLKIFTKGQIYWTTKKLNNPLEKQTNFLTHQLQVSKENNTLIENLTYVSTFHQQNKETFNEMLTLIKFNKIKNCLIKQISSGQLKRIEIINLIAFTSPIWILDEPITNLDTNSKKIIKNLIKLHLKNQGIIIITSHEPLYSKKIKTITL